MDIELEVAQWLTSPEGLAQVSWIAGSLDDGSDELAIAEGLRRSGIDGPRRGAALAAAVARRRARRRWTDADQLLFTREGLEQASDPEVSRWRTRRFPARVPVIDLCAGVGGDTMALVASGREVMAVDRDAGRLELLRHNVASRGGSAAQLTADALEVALPPTSWVHVDPGRRRDGRRVRRLRDHVPPVDVLARRLRDVAGSGIVLSPAVDLADPDLPDGELEFVQVEGDLVESVLWMGEARRDAAAASCTRLPEGEHLVRTGPQVELPVGPVGDHLLTVAPAAVRARLHGEVGERLEARRLATNRALLTCDGAPPADPWVTARPVEAVLPMRTKAVRSWLRAASTQPVEIAVHGLDLDPDRWWRELGRPPRGPRGRRLEAIRGDRGGMVVVTGPAL